MASVVAAAAMTQPALANVLDLIDQAAGQGASVTRLSITEPRRLGEAGAGWETLEDRKPVLLDYTLQLDGRREIAVFEEPPGGGALQRRTLSACNFGLFDSIRRVYPVTGDTHTLVTVTLGTPERHAANLAYCGYRAAGTQTLFILRGCFLAQSLPIPTAVHWVLTPLPAAACGLAR
ncbi:MAG: hypothetical protein AAFV96_02240 [Pseudomonadota bacterium]